MLLHPGSPHDSSLYDEVMTDLKRRIIIKIGDLVVFDKGYYSYGNYVDGIFKFDVVPLIFSKKNFSLKKLLNMPNYPIWISGWSDTSQPMLWVRSLATRLFNNLRDIPPFMEKRSLIEDVFKKARNALSSKKIHKYNTRSMIKTVFLLSFYYNSLFLLALIKRSIHSSSLNGDLGKGSKVVLLIE